NHFMRSSSALLIIGMLTGSVWARQAWGDYWAWDPKENWAAVTWFVSLIFLHLMNKKGMKAATILILAFLALQITWYGVNYLPSAMSSIHTYNQ
ncbi:MAG: cytochrome c biogenesis protein CcsA, partial [Prevotellaceae bacterium]|nr:cytochrome c biogenesis protein CcsA [Prevotellaceae bacterium]